MDQIEPTQKWHQAFPGGHVGVLQVRSVDNTGSSAVLDKKKKDLERRLRKQMAGFTRSDISELEAINAYRKYYKKFKKTYHVQLQLESIVMKNKSLPRVSPLVDANFIAEMETLVLTAGHDADLLVGKVVIDATKGDESFTQMNGTLRTLKPNDMMMLDEKGIVCTIIYGQDIRTPITPDTRHALYVAYAPSGVPQEAVENQLDAIEENIQLFAPKAVVQLRRVFSAGTKDQSGYFTK